MTASASLIPAAAPADAALAAIPAALLAQTMQGALPLIDLFNAAQTLGSEGREDAAIALYQLWLDNTTSTLAYAVCFNLAIALSNRGDEASAEQLYLRAIGQNPDFVEARLNLGTLLERLGRPDEALAAWNAILTVVQPPVAGNQALHLQTLNNLGRLLEIQKRYPEAEATLAHSLRIQADQPNVMTHWVHLRQKQCEWPVYSGLEHISVEQMMEGTSALAMLSASADPAWQLAAARRYVTEKVITAVEHLTGEHGYDHPRLRIGYLSSDFCSHAVSILTAELYELHDRSKVEVFAFSWSREDHSPIRARVVKAMDHYIRIDALSDEQAARLIRSHEIDILVDLHGLTLGARPNILSYRPAPVQLTYLGFPGTTALPQIDYVLADEFLLPPESAAFCTEKPLYLPTFQINDRQRTIGPRPSRASCQLPEQAFVFCSFNNNFKFTPEVFAVWMAILKRVPHSVLWLVADNHLVRDNLWRHAERAGIARERLIFANRAAPAEYLARYQLADLFLDTFPFNAGTTASDALWAGLPLLTCAGTTFAARMAGSLLLAVDLPELITHNFADYEELAVALAADPARIEAMKRQLVENRLSCALFDSPRFVRNLEAALLQVAKKPAPASLGPASREPGPALPGLLGLLPAAARKVVQIGCGDGALARAYKALNPHCHYIGIEADDAAAGRAGAGCDRVFIQDIELPDAARERETAGADCWVIALQLERMRAPWAALRAVRASMAPGATLVLAVRNFQHWTTQLRLCAGDYRYGDGALLAPGELHQFTRGSLLDLLRDCGFRLTGGMPLLDSEPGGERVLPILRQLAEAAGIDADQALQDALPRQYLLTATPD